MTSEEKKKYQKEYMKLYRKTHKRKYDPEQNKKWCASYREKHHEELKKKKKLWYNKNRSKILKRVKNYKKENPEKVRASKRNYKYKRKLWMKESDITTSFLLSLREATEYCCVCGKKLTDKNAQLDHILPLNAGGTHTRDNVRYICGKCNNKRPLDGSDVFGKR